MTTCDYRSGGQFGQACRTLADIVLTTQSVRKTRSFLFLHLIQLVGRWGSAAILRYIQHTGDHALRVAEAQALARAGTDTTTRRHYPSVWPRLQWIRSTLEYYPGHMARHRDIHVLARTQDHRCQKSYRTRSHTGMPTIVESRCS